MTQTHDTNVRQRIATYQRATSTETIQSVTNATRRKQMSNLSKLSEEILTQMYAAADPPLDFQEVLDNRHDFDENWYQQHTLSEERQHIAR